MVDKVIFSAQKDNEPNKQRISILSGNLLNNVASPSLRHLPLSLDNRLPAAVLRFGSSNNNALSLACHLDSCAAMHIGSLLLYQWIITTYRNIVDSYEQYDDEHLFQPITLDCAIPASKAEKDTRKLSIVVT